MLDALKTKLKLAVNLPSPPAIALQIIALAAEPDADVASIASAISKDPGLTAKILRVANSSMYARGRQSSNLRQAVVLLGLNAATTLALSFSLVSTYKVGKGSGIDYPGFWRRAVLGASAARTFAKRASAADMDDVFLGALLQDIAVLAIDRVQPEFYSALPIPITHTNLIDHEREVLGVDHAHVTAWLLRHWKLPESLSVMTEASHEPTSVGPELPQAAAARCIALGSECVEVLVAAEGQAGWPRLAAKALEWLQLEPEALGEAMADLIAEIPETEALFDTSLLDPESASAILEQARELLMLRNLQALDQVTSLKESSEELTMRTTILEDKHRRDPLTGLFNRGHLDEVLNKEFHSASAGGWPLSVAFVDLDHFKLINDTYGHPAGDAVLVATAKHLLGLLRDSDCVARYGGEEFVVVLPGLDGSQAAKVCERLLASLREAHHAASGRTIRSTASVGLATHTAGATFSNVTELIETADRAVYAAKRAGRDQLVRFDSATPA